MFNAVFRATVEQFVQVEIRHCRFAFSAQFLSYFVFRRVVSGGTIRKLICSDMLKIYVNLYIAVYGI